MSGYVVLYILFSTMTVTWCCVVWWDRKGNRSANQNSVCVAKLRHNSDHCILLNNSLGTLQITRDGSNMQKIRKRRQAHRFEPTTLRTTLLENREQWRSISVWWITTATNCSSSISFISDLGPELSIISSSYPSSSEILMQRISISLLLSLSQEVSSVVFCCKPFDSLVIDIKLITIMYKLLPHPDVSLKDQFLWEWLHVHSCATI